MTEPDAWERFMRELRMERHAIHRAYDRALIPPAEVREERDKAAARHRRELCEALGIRDDLR